jgi:ribose transport system ATP-binding protein
VKSPSHSSYFAISISQPYSATGHAASCGLLVLDEPTPFLPRHDVDKLFALVRSIVAQGASVIFVSHDVDEVLEITDRATVLRDGMVAGTLITAQSSKQDFIEMIIGRRLEPLPARPTDFGRQKGNLEIQGYPAARSRA